MEKNRITVKISFILAVACLLFFLISCTENNSLVLCNISLETDYSSRSFNSLHLTSNLSPDPSYYSAVYKGKDSNYYGAKTHAKYDSKKGIILSQGLWEIACEWKDPISKETIATGTTGDVWVNLNTTSFVVYLDSNKGVGSVSLSYEVTCSDNSVSDVSYKLTISQYNGETLNPIITSSEGTIIEGALDNSIKAFSFNADSLNVGKYLLKIEVYDNDLLFTDVLGFVVRAGHNTEVTGSCDVKKGTTGESIYLPPNIIDPVSPPTGVIVDVGNNANQTKLNKTTIEDGKIYYVQPDGSGSSMSLDHINSNIDSARISAPSDNSIFGINLNGTDVIMTTGTKENIFDDYYKENALVIALENKSTMTVYNYNKSGGKDATWAKMAGTRRFQTNTILKDGKLNIVGKNAIEVISNAGIIFLGPTHDNNETTVSPGITESGRGEYIKQGAINLESDENHQGGSLVLDGDVIVKAVTGISSWQSKTKTFSNIPYYSYTWDPTINDTLNTEISIINGAKIEAVGDTKRSVNKDVATGIFILGNYQSGEIKIIIDNGRISASGSKDANEAGIRIENFNGSINIVIRNPQTTLPSISSESGSGLLFKDCPNVNITIESDNPDSVISGASNKRITLDKSKLNLTVNGKTIENRTDSIVSINELMSTST